jgi:hypothetical protein
MLSAANRQEARHSALANRHLPPPLFPDCFGIFHFARPRKVKQPLEPRSRLRNRRNLRSPFPTTYD